MYHTPYYAHTTTINDENIQNATFQPIASKTSKDILPFCQICQLAHTYSSLTKVKILIKSLSIAALSLMGSGDTFTSHPLTSIDRIKMNGALIVAMTSNYDTHFSNNGVMHGFGYDMARQYAKHLGVNIIPKSYDNEKQMLAAVKSGEAHIALAATQPKSPYLTSTALNCNQVNLSQYGLNDNINLAFSKKDSSIRRDIQSFLCADIQLAATENLAKFYDSNLLKNDYSRQHFTRALSERLPNYQAAFQSYAKEHNLDWQLLAAIGYQESHLTPDAMSPTGVRGIMMLTNETASAMGINDRNNPNESIAGGARYLQRISKEFSHIPEPDRLWFILASYNMGPNAIKQIQKTITQKGEDANSWLNVYTYLIDNAKNNSRYQQCVRYVSNVRIYLENIKTQMS